MSVSIGELSAESTDPVALLRLIGETSNNWLLHWPELQRQGRLWLGLKALLAQREPIEPNFAANLLLSLSSDSRYEIHGKQSDLSQAMALAMIWTALSRGNWGKVPGAAGIDAALAGLTDRLSVVRAKLAWNASWDPAFVEWVRRCDISFLATVEAGPSEVPFAVYSRPRGDTRDPDPTRILKLELEVLNKCDGAREIEPHVCDWDRPGPGSEFEKAMGHAWYAATRLAGRSDVHGRWRVVGGGVEPVDGPSAGFAAALGWYHLLNRTCYDPRLIAMGSVRAKSESHFETWLDPVGGIGEKCAVVVKGHPEIDTALIRHDSAIGIMTELANFGFKYLRLMPKATSEATRSRSSDTMVIHADLTREATEFIVGLNERELRIVRV